MATLAFNISRKGYLVGGGILAIFTTVIWLASQQSFSTSIVSPLPASGPEPPVRNIIEDISNSTLGFKKIFIMSLPTRTDHRDAMSLAAALTGLEFEFVDGVTEVAREALPPGGEAMGVSAGVLGSWRAHLNILQRIVKEGIPSALILEDDVDWDLRIKQQMKDFARASRLLVQPIRGTNDTYLDPTHPRPDAGDQATSFDVRADHPILEPSSSPYGDLDRWDVFWIGHCGCRFPGVSDVNAPLGRAVLNDDMTVPEPQHVQMQFGSTELVDQYPAHTRVVSRTRQAACSIAYAVSQDGARRLLYELGVARMSSTLDLMLRSLCDGVDGRRLLTCLSPQPQLFQHHRPVGSKSSFSDIVGHGDEYNSQAFTRNVRWSTKLNFEKLINGEDDYIDLFRDGEPAPELGW